MEPFGIGISMKNVGNGLITDNQASEKRDFRKIERI